ncbi:endothelin-converting enzyme 1 [Plakobranchus ocellatus]|uniref:Endothelin-converting enzyme 1 n=1 Tax=Plakobranchus ocellatus TaxID=259542 RepID=A0AAV4ADX2_9GAST|nr:endothelin-converting enzyme 1 [Plakobranchus ocellatus]
MNGFSTQAENVADNGGLKASYRAYKKLVKKKGTSKLLPGLNLTQDQLFFLGYAQSWCSKLTKERAVLQVDSRPHSPGRFRF